MVKYNATHKNPLPVDAHQWLSAALGYTINKSLGENGLLGAKIAQYGTKWNSNMRFDEKITRASLSAVVETFKNQVLEKLPDGNYAKALRIGEKVVSIVVDGADIIEANFTHSPMARIYIDGVLVGLAIISFMVAKSTKNVLTGTKPYIVVMAGCTAIKTYTKESINERYARYKANPVDLAIEDIDYLKEIGELRD